jgi:predicted site-specific integrase-resolvase
VCVCGSVYEVGGVGAVGGVHPQAAYAWVRQDRMPVAFGRLPSGTIVVDVAAPADDQRVVLYARASAHDQRSDLDW